MKNIDLESERLLYKRVSAEHISSTYVSWINDPQVNQYLEIRGNYNIDLLTTYINHSYDNAIYFWAIHLKGSNKHIGNIKIDPINLEDNSGEYGILMGDKTEWGKGYAKEASLTILNYCFEKLKLSKVTLGVVEENINAVSLYKKIGFVTKELRMNVGTYNNKLSNSLRMYINAGYFK